MGGAWLKLWRAGCLLQAALPSLPSVISNLHCLSIMTLDTDINRNPLIWMQDCVAFDSMQCCENCVAAWSENERCPWTILCSRTPSQKCAVCRRQKRWLVYCGGGCYCRVLKSSQHLAETRSTVTKNSMARWDFTGSSKYIWGTRAL